jgi:hypothetical protein
MMRRLLREPALHFAVAGAALFALHALVRKPASSRIVVDRAVVLGLREQHARLLGAAPSPAQERELVERWIDEEVLAREAAALGLDRGDPIVRGRLAQKMRFLQADLAPPAEPADAELRAFLAAHPRREPALLTVGHVYVSRGRDPAPLLAALRRGQEVRGDAFLVGPLLEDRTEEQLGALFGGEAARAIVAVPEGTWSAVASPYGTHLVQVRRRIPGHDARLEEVREQVREALLAARREEADRALVQRLRGKYRIEVDAPAAPLEAQR